MKKVMIFLTIVVFVVTLTMPALGAEAPKPGATQPSMQQIPVRPAVQGPPDLVVQSIDHQWLTSGQYVNTYNVVITIRNGGIGPAGPFSVRVEKRKETCPTPTTYLNYIYCTYTPWEVLTVYNISGLSAGATKTNTLPDIFTDTIIPASGTSTTATSVLWNIRVTADSGQAVNESNEGNNIGTMLYVY